MKRRVLLTLPAWLALSGAACSAVPSNSQPSYKVSEAQLQAAVAKRFPRSYPVGGLVDLTVQVPQLRLLPAQNRLGTDMVLQAAGQALGRSYTGDLDVDFALRYEPSDRSIRAYQLRVNALRFADLPPGPAMLLNSYAPKLAEQSLREVVLHQLKPQDLALTDTMGLQPDTITVTAQGLVIGFAAKPAP